MRIIGSFVLNHEQEVECLKGAPQPLRDVAMLILDAGLRLGEGLAPRSGDVDLEPTESAKFSYLKVREGRSKAA